MNSKDSDVAYKITEVHIWKLCTLMACSSLLLYSLLLCYCLG